MKSRLKNIYAILFTVVLILPLAPHALAQDDPWDKAEKIRAKIKDPSFPDKDFPVTDYGAVGDGTKDCTDAFKKAIQACHAAGGGRVVVPPGRFQTAAIHLLSNVNLHVSKGATLLFDRDPSRYLPAVLTRFEAIELMNYSPLIYAFEQENIAVTGEGELNGQADELHWWFWKGKSRAFPQDDPRQKMNQLEANERLKKMAADNVPVSQRVFGDGDYLRPSFIEPYRCKNVLIEGVTIRDSPMWIIHPVLSENVIIRKVKVISHGPNNDGCDPESSKNVLIEDCLFDTGDDCIAIKSGRDHDGRRVNVPSENIIVRGCTMKDGHGGVVIGSEISGNVRNVYAENCTMSSPNLDRALRIKSNSRRGGIAENIYMRNITVGDLAEAVLHIDLFYFKETGKYIPTVRNVEMTNVTSQHSPYAIYINSDDAYPVRNIVIRNCQFNNVEKGNFLHGVKDIKLENVTINGVKQ